MRNPTIYISARTSFVQIALKSLKMAKMVLLTLLGLVSLLSLTHGLPAPTEVPILRPESYTTNEDLEAVVGMNWKHYTLLL